MALLKDYGDIDYNVLLNKDTYSDATATLIGILNFQIVTEKSNEKGFLLEVYEKSFWGKKEKGYLSFKFIEDQRADTSRFKLPNGNTPPFCDILLGFEFSSVYKKIYVNGNFIPYELGSARKQVLSYGIFINHLKIFHESFCNLYNEKLMGEVSSVDPFNGSNNPFQSSGMIKGERNRYEKAIQKLEFFKKFEPLSLSYEK